MPKKKGPMTVEEILAKLREAGLSSTNVIKTSTQDEMSELDTLAESSVSLASLPTTIQIQRICCFS